MHIEDAIPDEIPPEFIIETAVEILAERANEGSVEAYELLCWLADSLERSARTVKQISE